MRCPVLRCARHAIHALACIALLGGSATAAAAPTTGRYWKPHGIASNEVALDPVRHRLLAIGSSLEAAELYALPLSPGESWQRLEATGARPPRVVGRSIAWDGVHDRLIVQGGAQKYSGCGCSGSCRVYRSNTEPSVWSLSLSGTPNWTRLGDLRIEGAPLVADPERQRFLLYGGFYLRFYEDDGLGGIDSLAYFRDLWQLDWNTDTWTRIGHDGPEDAYQVAALDPVRDRLIVMRARAPRTVWALPLEGAPEWVPIHPTGIEPALAIDRAEYDPGTDALLLFSGGSISQLTLGETPAWQAVSTTGPLTTVHAWDPDTRRAWAYRAGEPALELDATSGWSWTTLAGAPQEDARFPDRWNHSVAFDRLGERTYLVGGNGYVVNDCHESYPYLSDLWSIGDPDVDGCRPQALDGPLPTRLAPGITSNGFVFDPVRNRLVLAGGAMIPIPGPDAWVLTPGPVSNWSGLDVAGTPPAFRYIGASAYDAAADRALFFGGPPGDDLWAINFAAGPAWEPLAIAGEPEEFSFSSSAWDPLRRRLWVLDAGNLALAAIDVANAPAWRSVPVAGVAPPAGAACQLTYDERRDRLVVLLGGPAPWLWEIPLTSPEWREVAVEGEKPKVYSGASFSYDAARDRALLIGGGIGTNPAGTSWLYVLRFDPDSPTAVSAALAAQDVTPTRVRLEWRVADAAGVTFTLSRSEDSVSWTPLAPPEAPGDGRVVMQDASVHAGSRYAYRLQASEGAASRTLDQVWVQVPSECALRLDGARPNPVAGPLRMSFALMDGAPATLEVLDVQGRSRARVDVGGLGAGEHVLAVVPRQPLEPGLYFARLVTTHGVRLARFGVVR